MEHYEHNTRINPRIRNVQSIIGALASNGDFIPIANNCYVVDPVPMGDIEEEHE